MSQGDAALKIVHVAHTLAPSYGGPVTVLDNLSKAQVKAGHSVLVLSTNADPAGGVIDLPEDRWTEIEGVRVFTARVSIKNILYSKSFSSAFKGEALRADIVHVHGLYRYPQTFAAWYARKAGVPYIVQPHGALDPYLHTKSSRSVLLKRLYERLFDFPNLRGAGAIQFSSEEERTRAGFLGFKAPTYVVPNGLDWDRFRQLPPRGPLRARFKLGDAPLILFVGRLHKRKGLDLLVSAFDELRHSHPGARLLIVGPENDVYGRQLHARVVERGLREQVTFAGPLYGAELIQAYVDADVFALPSYTESFGMTIVEAMACGLPVVITDQVKIRGEVTAAGAGMVTRCDAGEIKSVLAVLLTNYARRRVMGEAGRHLVQRCFTWSRIVPMLTQEYEKVIARC